MMARSTDSATECLDWFCDVAPDSARFSVTLVAAHPDDEIIGAGVQLSKLGRATVLFLTDGAPRNTGDAWLAGFSSVRQYAEARSSEALSALSLCGLSQQQVLSLRIPDQEAARNLVFVSRSMASILQRLASDIVVTHPYEGGHPDHDSAAFCVRAASALLRRARRKPPTAILEFTSYHARGDGIESGRFLTNGGGVKALRLTAGEQRLKRELFARYATQCQVLLQFGVSIEAFRLAPEYDFTKLPEAPIYYDRFDWGLRSAEWPGLVADAIHELKLSDSSGSRHTALR
jgi:N-acetylglucosamine malate deacetylase 2